MNTKFIVSLIVVAIIAIFVGVIVGMTYEKDLGANAGPDNYNLVNFQGGIRGSSAMFMSTTTVACMIQNNIGATSTWKVAFKTNAATTTTTVLGVSTSTNANRFATSTALTSVTIAANAVGAGSYVPTSNVNIIGPGEWILVGYGAGTTLPTVAQAQRGECSALFERI